MLIQNEVVVDAGIIHALKHHNITNYFGGHEYILHFNIRNEIVEPVLAKFGDTTHLEEVR